MTLALPSHLRLLSPNQALALRPMIKPAQQPAFPAHLRLMTPSQAAVRNVVSITTRAFRMGPKIAPHRAAYEFYPTPPEATRALLSVESFDGPIWEPACGEGHISKVLEATGHTVISTDLATRWNYGEGGQDFLRESQARAKHIVTNPPYGRGLADAFVGHALRLTKQTGGRVAMLLALQSLAHPMRHEFWSRNRPSRIYALDDCQCWPYGDPTRATTAIGKQRYVWVIWDGTSPATTIFGWLSTKPFKAT